MPSTAPARFLAADWGTSNLRAWLIGEDGRPQGEERFPWGVAKLQPGQPAQRLAQDIRPALHAEDLPAVMCGMIGSNLGILEVGYLECPAGIEEVSAALRRVPGQTPELYIAPGLRCRRPSGDPDVMRGEETKLLGWVSLGPARSRGRHLLCLPGTHTKWVVIEEGRIVRFVTAMSGELFDVLSGHSVLRTEKGETRREAYELGLRKGAEPGALAAKLFTARSRVVADGMAKDWVRDYVSGLLIGDETAALPAMLGVEDARQVELLGDPSLCTLYEAALAARGIATRSYLGDEAVLAGLKALFERRTTA